jgi:CARDB protein
MPRRQLILAAALLVVTATAGLAAGSLASPLPEEAARLASVRVVHCDVDDHMAVFRARMRRVEDARRMSMRFAVFERVEGGRYQRLHVSGLGRWRKSHRWVKRFGYRQRVRGLRENAYYRARVDFRWLDADGDVVRRARRRSKPCSTVRGSNLTVTGIAAHLLVSDARYAVKVRNRGNAPSPASVVALAVDGASPITKPVPALAPREGTTVVLRARRCNDTARATVDPGGDIAELNEHDNTLDGGCPTVY